MLSSKVLFIALVAMLAVTSAHETTPNVNDDSDVELPHADQMEAGDESIDLKQDDSEINAISDAEVSEKDADDDDLDDEEVEKAKTDAQEDEEIRRRVNSDTLSCNAQIEAQARENAKNRPVLIQELKMIKILSRHLKKLVDTKEAQEDMQINNLDTGASSQKTLADLMEDVENGEGRSYSETKQIEKLLAQLKGKLRTSLFRQRHKLIMRINSCRRVARAQVRRHRHILLRLREKRRVRRQQLWRAQKDYQVALGAWKEGARLLKLTIIKANKELSVIAKERRLLRRLIKLIKRVIKQKSEVATEEDIQDDAELNLDESARAEIAAITSEVGDNAELLDLVTEIGRPSPQARAIKRLLKSLRVKILREKARIEAHVRREKAKQERRRIHKNNMYARIKPARVRLQNARQRVRNQRARVAGVIRIRIALDRNRYLTETADGQKETADEKAATKAAHAHHAREMVAHNRAARALRRAENKDRKKEKAHVKRFGRPGAAEKEAEEDVDTSVDDGEEHATQPADASPHPEEGADDNDKDEAVEDDDEDAPGETEAEDEDADDSDDAVAEVSVDTSAETEAAASEDPEEEERHDDAAIDAEFD